MKQVTIRRDPKFASIPIFAQVMRGDGRKPLSLEEIRKRCRVLEVLEDVKETDATFDLEDADHETLVKALEGFEWALADRELLKTINTVLEATDPKEAK